MLGGAAVKLMAFLGLLLFLSPGGFYWGLQGDLAGGGAGQQPPGRARSCGSFVGSGRSVMFWERDVLGHPYARGCSGKASLGR